MTRLIKKPLMISALAASALLFGAASALATPSDVHPAPPGKVRPYHPDRLSPRAISESKSQCPIYRLCMWWDSNYGGLFWSAGGSNSTWQYVGSAGGENFNDKASSVWNRRTNSSWVNKDYPGRGNYVCIGGGGGWYYSNLQNNEWPDGSGANDSISSFWLPNSTYNNCSQQYQFLPNN
jgi:Peptidase inhibitor family I36